GPAIAHLVVVIKGTKIRDGPEVSSALAAILTGFVAYVFLKSVQPFPGNALSGLVYILCAGVWILPCLWLSKHVLVWRKIEITAQQVSEETFFAIWRIRTRLISFDATHFVDFV